MTLHYINLALIFEDIKCHQSHKICDLALIVTDMNEVIRWLQVAVLRAVLDAPTKSERLPVGGPHLNPLSSLASAVHWNQGSALVANKLYFDKTVRKWNS